MNTLLSTLRDPEDPGLASWLPPELNEPPRDTVSQNWLAESSGGGPSQSS